MTKPWVAVYVEGGCAYIESNGDVDVYFHDQDNHNGDPDDVKKETDAKIARYPVEVQQFFGRSE